MFAATLSFAAAYDIDGQALPREALRDHSLVPPFLELEDWPSGIPGWRVGGSTVVTDRHIRLTPSLPSTLGWVWSSIPLDATALSVELRAWVRLHGPSHLPGADGLGIWLLASPPMVAQVADEAAAKPASGMYGVDADFNGLGLIVDSYDNDGRHDNPTVLLVHNNGRTRDWGVGADFALEASFRCAAGDARNTGPDAPLSLRLVLTPEPLVAGATRAKVNAKVFFGVVGSGKAETYCGEATGLELPPSVSIGISAATGGLADAHDLVALQVFSPHS